MPRTKKVAGEKTAKKLLTVKTVFNPKDDYYECRINFAPKCVKVLDEFAVKSGKREYTDGKMNKYRHLIRRLLTTVHNFDGNLGVLFDVDGGKRRSVYFSSTHEADAFVKDIEGVFKTIASLRIDMKRKASHTISVREVVENGGDKNDG